MQQFFSYFQDFFQQNNKLYAACCTLFVALLIFLNYKLGLEPKWINDLPGRPAKISGFYGLYLLAFGIPYLLHFLFNRENNFPQVILALILLAPVIFAIKAGAGGWKELIQNWQPGPKGRFWSTIADWPLRLLITFSLLFILYMFLPKSENPFGLAAGNLTVSTYMVLLACMIPLITYVSTQPSFLHVYPTLKTPGFLQPAGPTSWQKLLYELSYGSDFITIELFFRGFLVIYFARFIGPAAIIPMAVFYCSIHFGKPLLECISSYLGGVILGVVACYSNSIWGGIIIHLGLAWMMELAAVLALHLKQ